MICGDDKMAVKENGIGIDRHTDRGVLQVWLGYEAF
jgi:hypothetical protein